MGLCYLALYTGGGEFCGGADEDADCVRDGDFSIVGDGSGVDFDIPVNSECPGFGDSWGLETKTDCPAVKTKSENAVGDPCKARLTSSEQVKCIWEYVSRGKNETERCLAAFERADMDWSKYYYPPFADENTGVDSEDDSSGSNGSDTSSTGTGSSSGDSKEDVGVSHRPGLSGLAFAVFGAVVVVMAL